jgi:hypothetical protein
LSSNNKEMNDVLLPYILLVIFSLCTTSTSRLSGHLKGRGHLEDLGLEDRLILKWSYKKYDGRLCTGLVWFRVRKSGRLLWTRQWYMMWYI